MAFLFFCDFKNVCILFLFYLCAESSEESQMQADYIFLHPGRGSHRKTVSSTQPSDRHQFHNAREELETEGVGGGSVGVCDVAGGLSIRPRKCLILPKHLSADRWPRSEFVISDHRPLLGVYQVERHAIMSN